MSTLGSGMMNKDVAPSRGARDGGAVGAEPSGTGATGMGDPGDAEGGRLFPSTPPGREDRPLFGGSPADAEPSSGPPSGTPRRRLLFDADEAGAILAGASGEPTTAGASAGVAAPVGSPPAGPPPPGPRPPAGSPDGPTTADPSAAPSSSTAVGEKQGRIRRLLRGEEVTGLVSGTVAGDQRFITPPSRRPIVLLALIWAVLAVVNAVRGSAAPALIAVGLVVAFLGLLLLGLVVGQVARAGALEGLRVAGVLIRAGGGAVVAGAVPVRRFQVQTVDGRTWDCVMRGDVDSDEVRAGDPVRVRGRRGRHGVLTVHRMEVLSGIGGIVVRRVRAEASAQAQAAELARPLVLIGTASLLLLIGQQLWTLLR